MEHVQSPVPDDSVGSFCYDVMLDRWTWSAELFQCRGLDPGRDEPSTGLFFLPVLEQDQPVVKSAIEAATLQAGSFSTRFRIRIPSGGLRWILMVGEGVGQGGRVSQVRGFTVDLTGPLRAAASDAVCASARHRAAIEQVKGALMLACDVDDDEAFAILVHGSQDLNEKVWHLAERVARGLAATRLDDERPRRSLLQLFLPKPAAD